MDHKSRESNYLKPRPAVERFARPGLFVVGLLLMVSGMVAAFNPKLQGLSVSTLLAAGFAVLFVGHLGDRLTSIRFREFEARLEKAVTEAEHETERVRREASAALHELEKAAEAYSATRARMEPGGDRDDAMSRDLEDLTKKVQETPPTVERVRSLSRSPDEKDRVTALAAMRSNPALWDFDSVLYAIDHPIAGFEHDRFIVVAADMLHRLEPSDRDRLLAAVKAQQRTGKAKPGRIRWHSAERLRLLIEARTRDASTAVPDTSVLKQSEATAPD